MSNATDVVTTKEDIAEIIVGHACEILGLERREVSPEDSLREIGANSVDRADIIMSALETLSFNIPLVELANARNINELADIIHAKS